MDTTTESKTRSYHLMCNRLYRVWLVNKWSEARHCIKPKGHKGKCGKGTVT